MWLALTLLSVPIANKVAKGNRQERGLFLYGLSFPNSNAVATPLLLAFMGMAGLFQMNLFTLFMVITTYAWGIGLFLDVEKKNPIKRFLIHLCNPTFIALLIGLFLGAIGAKNWMPTVVCDFLGDLSGCFVPVSMILTGYMIAEYPLKSAFQLPKSYLFAFLRLLVIPGLALLAVWFLGLPKNVATLTVLFFSGPCGMNVVVFPAAYGQDCKTGVSLVLLSTLGALITVPIMYALLQLIYP